MHNIDNRSTVSEKVFKELLFDITLQKLINIIFVILLFNASF